MINQPWSEPAVERINIFMSVLCVNYFISRYDGKEMNGSYNFQGVRLWLVGDIQEI